MLTEPHRLFFLRLSSAVLWVASFCYAAAFFLVISNDVTLPATAPSAIGRVTVEKVSKLEDYVLAALYYALVPILSVLFFHLFARSLEHIRKPLQWRLRESNDGQRELLITLIFSLPFVVAPMFYLTTKKELWGVLLPPFLGAAAAVAFVKFQTVAGLRALLGRSLQATNLLLICEAFSWISFRYLATGERIAHIPTLFLESIFIFFFVGAFWFAAVLICAVAARVQDKPLAELLPRFAAGASPFLLLPLFGLFLAPADAVIVLVLIAVVVAIISILPEHFSTPVELRDWLAWGAIPILLFCVNWGSTFSPWNWTDLFHRGEALGPASDYLRGKIPYRDVFVLHGLLDDGFLDAGLMKIFGRDVQVTLARLAVVDSLGLVAAWALGMILFDSVGLAAVTVAIALVTTAGAQRGLLEILTALFFIAAIQKRRFTLFGLSGVMAGLALFYSLDIGIYSIVGGLLALPALGLVRYRNAQRAVLAETMKATSAFIAGVLVAALPFLFYLTSRGALGEFVRISFIEIPSFIDAAWSLPYPDLSKPFRTDLSLRSLSDLVLGEPIRFILNPLVLGISVTCILARAWRRRWEEIDAALITLTIFGLITQRSALGRADFPHQYFSAFLIAPLLVLLLVLVFRHVKNAWEEGTGSMRAVLVLLLAFLFPLVYVVLWVPDLLNAKLQNFVRYKARITGVGYTEPLIDEVAPRVELVRKEVQMRTGKTDPIFDFSNQPALYFFSDRPNPTRFYQVPVISPVEHQREAILALQRARPRIVIRRSPSGFDVFDGIANELRTPALAAYIDDHYRYLKTVRGVELWERSTATMLHPLTWYLGKHRVPSPELVRNAIRARMFFPSVGSLQGIGGSFWRSDLIIHNPGSEPILLTVRYLAKRPVEKRITVPPGQTQSWPDVVSTLFGSSGTRGAIMLEFQAGHPPLARVRTFDSARGANGITESPLAYEDSADAASSRKRLVLVGVPGDGARRVSLGVVGVGGEPATFRIWATTPRGEVVGLPVEGAVEEQGIYVLAEANVRMGVPITPDLAVHIQLIRGKAIAFASVVDAASGNTQLIAAVPTGE